MQNSGEVFVREAGILIKHSAVGLASDYLRSCLISENIKVAMVRNAATNIEHFLTSHTPRMNRELHGSCAEEYLENQNDSPLRWIVVDVVAELVAVLCSQ